MRLDLVPIAEAAGSMATGEAVRLGDEEESNEDIKLAGKHSSVYQWSL